ncbi:hypothetical protein [Streptomyces sp. NPDC055709]
MEIISSARMVALLQHGSNPPIQRPLAPSETPNGLSMATATPLHKGQTLTYVMLVDGSDPEIELRASVSNAKFDRAPEPSLELTVASYSRAARIALGGAVAASAAAGVSTFVQMLQQ